MVEKWWGHAGYEDRSMVSISLEVAVSHVFRSAGDRDRAKGLQATQSYSA